MLFDHIARRAFCNSVDLEDQQEIVRTFSRAQEKATWLDQRRQKWKNFRFMYRFFDNIPYGNGRTKLDGKREILFRAIQCLSNMQCLQILMISVLYLWHVPSRHENWHNMRVKWGTRTIILD